jgi:hypothetical protein
MKIQVLLTALALACGAAYAQGSADSKMAAGTPQATTGAQASGEGLGAKTRRAMNRMGDATRKVTRNAVDKMKGNKDQPNPTLAQGGNPANETRTMGAASSTPSAQSDAVDSGRRQRMDDAYTNFKKK